MTDVFISYASEDRTRAKKLAEALEAKGFSVWWDRNIIAGQTYDEVIERELETATSVVVLWSKHSVISEWVKSEAQVAVERGTLVPAVIDAVKPPLEFRRKQTVDLVDWDGDLRHAGLDTLHRGISAHVARESPTQPPSDPARNAIPPTVDPFHLIETPTQPQAQTLEGKPKRRAFLWAGVATLLALGMVGLWVWDAFYRAHIDYYANVINARGQPEGIGPLSAEQVRSRSLTLEFLKDGRRGPVKEIRATNSRGAYPPEFVHLPSISLLDLNPLITEETEIFHTSRVTFEYGNGRLVKQTAYNRSDRSLYSLHYPRPDYAEYKWEVFSKVVSESGITHIKIVRPETGPEAKLNKDLLFQDSTGRPRPDNNGDFGYRRLFDKLGLTLETTRLGEHGQPAPNRLGIAKTVMEYDGLGNLTRYANLGVDGRLVAGRYGIAEGKLRYDQHGNITELAHFGADGQLVTLPKIGSAGRTFAYDGQGNLVETTFFGPQRQLVRGSVRGLPAFAKAKLVWDENGGSLETYFGPDGKLLPVGGNVIKRKAVWDKSGHLVEMAGLDENDRPVRDDRGCAKTKMGHDDHGNVTDLTCLDENDQPVRDNRGFARAKAGYDQRGNRLEETYFGTSGQLDLYGELYVRIRWQRNSQGKETEVTYFDAANKPVKTRNGFAKITYAYDVHGNQREVAFFDENGQPTVRRGGYAKILRTYDARNHLIEEITLNAEGKPVRSDDGYAKSRSAYDTRGYLMETTYYDERDGLTSGKEGCAKEGNKYNDKGQRTEWACFGTDGSSTVAKKHGFAKARQVFDASGKLSQVDYFDANDVPARSAKGYARIKYSYDDLGRETKREFFDVDGARVFTRVTIEKVEPDSMSKRAGLQAGDVIIAYDGQEVADNRRFRELELTSGERRRQLTIERADKSLILDVSAGRLTGIETADKVPAAPEKSIAIHKKRPG
jgi:YD repeat-containing protein